MKKSNTKEKKNELQNLKKPAFSKWKMRELQSEMHLSASVINPVFRTISAKPPPVSFFRTAFVQVLTIHKALYDDHSFINKITPTNILS